MNIPEFGLYQYYKFNNTFLTKVKVTLNFDKLEEKGEFDNRMSKFSLAEFGVEPSQSVYNGATLSTTNGSVVFNFQKDSVSVSISGLDYKSFTDTIIPLAYKLRTYIEDVISIKHIISASIRKVNVWQFENNIGNNPIDVNSIRKLIFSDAFNELKTNVELSEDEKNIDNFMRHRWEEKSNWFELRSTFLSIDTEGDDKDTYGLILDSIGFEENKMGIPLEKIDTTLKSINTNLYNAYMWSVNDRVKNIMRLGKES